MYKVLIVDDEINIRERLTHFLPWEEIGFEVAGSAENGLEALELIKEVHPHVILTDVRMPEMTGLELAKEMKASYPDIKVVILSAYDDFKYAQDAIHYGVKGYLLKPLMRKDFYEAFTNLAEELKEDVELKKMSAFDHTWNSQEKMLLDLIEGKNLHSYADQWNFEALCCRVAIFSFEKLLKEYSTFSLRQRITALAADFWKRYRVPVLFYGNSVILFITEKKPVSKKDFKPKIQMFIDTLKESLSELLKNGDSFVIGIGNWVRSIQEISRSYNEAVYACSYKYFNEYETIIFREDLSPSVQQGNLRQIQFDMLDYVKSIESRLLESIKKEQAADVSELLNGYFHALQQSGGHQIAEIRSNCSEFVIMLMFRLKEKGLSLPSIDNPQVLGKIYEIDSLNELKRWLKQILETISFDLAKKDDKDYNRYVLLAKEYVDAHFQEKITLEEISNILFLHQAYFSAIFKKETGQNFIDYVNKVKVEKAAKLLRNSEYKIKDISDMVGFHSHSYFNKVFKNDIGVTPVVYRRMQKR